MQKGFQWGDRALFGSKDKTILVQGQNLNNLITSLNYVIGEIAIEMNGRIIPNSQYPDIKIAENDNIEIVEFVGGG